jgi:colicin import membrane protein
VLLKTGPVNFYSLKWSMALHGILLAVAVAVPLVPGCRPKELAIPLDFTVVLEENLVEPNVPDDPTPAPDPKPLPEPPKPAPLPEPPKPAPLPEPPKDAVAVEKKPDPPKKKPEKKPDPPPKQPAKKPDPPKPPPK